MLLEVLPSRHEKLPLKEYLLLRTASMKVFLTRPGRKAKGAVKPNMVFLLFIRKLFATMGEITINQG
jgi:hypothetical protein